MALFGKRAELFTGCMVLSILASPAMAQSVAVAGQPSVAEEASTDIIVTAQRREQRLVDVPVTIVAQTGAQLERTGVTNIRDLGLMVPGLVVAGGGNTVAPTIRGVFSGQTDPGNDGNIAIYVDGVYQAMQIANQFDLPDVDRVEVLMGPQGTLFGRNAAGGAIRIFTISPDLEKSSGQVTVGYGRFNEKVAKGYARAPIIPGVLAASVSADYVDADGINTNIVTGKDSGGRRHFMARGKLLFVPTDALRIEAFASHSYTRNNDVLAMQPLDGSTIGRYIFPGAVVPTEKNTYGWTGVPKSTARRLEFGVRASLDVGVGTISNLAAWGRNRIYYLNDQDMLAENGSTIPAHLRHRDFQDELLFTSNKFGGFQATVGAFYYEATGRFLPLTLSGPIYGGAACVVPNPAAACYNATINIHGVQRTKSWAGFGQADYDLTDRLTLTAGIRYSTERRRARSGFFSGPAFLYPNRPADSAIPVLGEAKFDGWSPRASIRYGVTDEGDNVYFTFSKGFKSGGFGIAAAQKMPWQPETVTAYEVGLKTSTRRRLSANFAAFYYDYANQQVSVNNSFTNVTTNAASSRLWGLEVQAVARVTDSFTLSGNGSYLNAKYRDFTNATIILPGNALCNLCGNRNAIVDLSGAQMPRAPKFSANLSANYNKDFSFGNVNATGTISYLGSFNWDVAGVVRNPSYVSLGLSAFYTPEGSRLTFGIWGKDLNDPEYYATSVQSANAIGVTYVRPSFGATIRYSFGD